MKARIYQPSKNAMQSGRAKTDFWVLECDDETRRGPESLMGWTAASDTQGQIRMKFDTVDDAIVFAKKKGWDYTLATAQARVITPRNYVDNFKKPAPVVKTSESK